MCNRQKLALMTQLRWRMYVKSKVEAQKRRQAATEKVLDELDGNRAVVDDQQQPLEQLTVEYFNKCETPSSFHEKWTVLVIVSEGSSGCINW